jgi:hypothetical protein
MRGTTCRTAAVGCVLGLLALLGAAGCDAGGEGIDPACCENLYPVWCARFADCDPLTFSLSWRELGDCTDEQVAACRAGTDTEHLCEGRTPSQTEACSRALTDADCADLFGSAGLPAPCRTSH